MEIKDIIHLTNSELNDYDLKSIEKDNLVSMITDYTYESREGYGIAIGKGKNGKFYKYDLGHCSCYGPFENGYSGIFTKEEIIKLIENYEGNYMIKEEKQIEIKKQLLEFMEKQ